MTRDAIDELLRDGLDPDADFVQQLEALLGRAYDGHDVDTSRGRSRARVLVAAASIGIVAAALVTIVVITRDERPTRIVTGPSTTVAAPSTVATDLSTTVPVDVAPSTSTSSPLPSATPAPTTNPTTPEEMTVIDLAAPARDLAPARVLSLPAAPREPNDPFPMFLAAPAPGNRIAVLDVANRTVRFVDAVSGVERARRPIAATFGMGLRPFHLWVGPGDVLYVNANVQQDDEQIPIAEDEGTWPLALVAYAPHDGTYREVARRPHLILDGYIEQGRDGVAQWSPPLMPYLDADGKPSGATLDIPTVARSWPDEYRTSAGRSWLVDIRDSSDTGLAGCEMCRGPAAGPLGTVIEEFAGNLPSGEVVRRLLVLGDEIGVYDPGDWIYVAALDDRAMFVRTLTDGTLEVGTFVTR